MDSKITLKVIATSQKKKNFKKSSSIVQSDSFNELNKSSNPFNHQGLFGHRHNRRIEIKKNEDKFMRLESAASLRNDDKFCTRRIMKDTTVLIQTILEIQWETNNRPCLYCRIFENTELENTKALPRGKIRGTSHVLMELISNKLLNSEQPPFTPIKTTLSNFETTNLYYTKSWCFFK